MNPTPRLLADVSSNGIITGLGKFLPFGAGDTSAPSTDPSAAPVVLNTLISTIIGFLTIIGGLAFLIYFIVGALSWITGGDDKNKVDSAKKYMTNGAIGLIVIVAAYAVTWIVGEVLGLNILNPADLILTITGGY